MQTTLLMLGCCAALLQQCEGIRCWKCRHTAVSNDNNDIVKLILGAIRQTVGNSQCEMQDSVNDKYGVSVAECPSSADSGMTYKCSTVTGKITASILGVAAIFDTTVRDCVQVPTGDSEFSGCKETATLSGPLKFLLTEAAKGLTQLKITSDVQFKGKTCYDDVGSVPARSSHVQCVTCSSRKLTSGTPGLAEVVSFFSGATRNKHCLMDSPDDMYKVPSKVCPQPASGEQAVCGVISGVASSEAADLQFETTERGCLTQPSGSPRSGCTSDLPPDGAVKNLLKEGLKGLKVKVTFTGTMCYSSSGFGKLTSSGLVGGTGSIIKPLTPLILGFCFSLPIALKNYF